MKKKKTPKSVQDSYAEMILRLAIAAEYKDEEIGTHIIRVSDYSTAIARALNLPPKDVEIIRFASIMHDIGKIGISDRILHKKNLTPKDYGRIKEHTLIGSRIFSGSNSALLKAAEEIALTHHERYDGSGYPYGLRGENIPLMGRIVALADSFDAIVSDRKYKKSRTLPGAIAVIKREKLTHFDPKVVKAFFKILPVIRQIFKANKTIEDFLRENRKLLRKGRRFSL